MDKVLAVLSGCFFFDSCPPSLPSLSHSLYTSLPYFLPHSLPTSLLSSPPILPSPPLPPFLPRSCQVRVAVSLAASLVRKEPELWVTTVQVLLELLGREMVGDEEGEREVLLTQHLIMLVRVIPFNYPLQLLMKPANKKTLVYYSGECCH